MSCINACAPLYNVCVPPPPTPTMICERGKKPMENGLCMRGGWEKHLVQTWSVMVFVFYIFFLFKHPAPIPARISSYIFYIVVLYYTHINLYI